MKNKNLFDFEFDKDEKCWSVMAYIGRSKEVIFPAFHKDIPVKKIGDEFICYMKIKRVTIPEGYTYIGAWAFYICIGLTEVKLPESLTSIGLNAFGGCKRLTEINFPKGLTSIEERAFLGCTGLKSIILPENLTYIEEAAFSGCTNLETITLSRKTRIGDKAFEGFKGQFIYLD